MNSPRGVMICGVSMAVALAVLGQRRISAAESAKSTAPTTVPAAQAAPVAQPAAPAKPVVPGPATPVVPRPPSRAAEPSVAPGALTTVAAPAPGAHPGGPAAGRDTGAAASMPAPGAGGSTAAPPPVVAPAAEGMPRGPSIYETGRVGKMGVTDSGATIKRTQAGEGGNREEQRVQGSPSGVTPVGVATAGHVDPTALARQLRPRLRLLRDCRVQVARQKHLHANDVPAGRLTLRWTILSTGRVSDTEVVALSPADGRVIDCVKRQMSLWSFAPPTGGPATVERAFKFE